MKLKWLDFFIDYDINVMFNNILCLIIFYVFNVCFIRLVTGLQIGPSICIFLEKDTSSVIPETFE